MTDSFHIHLPVSDEEISLIESALGIKFQRVETTTILSEKVDVGPMSDPDSTISHYK